jgi:hypothetical protein
MKTFASGLIALVAVIGLAITANATPNAAQGLVPDFQAFLIRQPVDVTDANESGIARAQIGRDQAVSLARQQYDKPDAPYRIYRAMSRKYWGSDDRDVWVVVLPEALHFSEARWRARDKYKRLQ